MKRLHSFRFGGRNARRFFVQAVVLCTLGFAALVAGEEEGVLSKVTAEVRVREEGEAWRYFLFLPQGYKGEPGKNWPLILWLHGRSLRGDNLEKLRRYGPPSFLRKRPGFPYIVICPQLPDGAWPADGLKSLLEECFEQYRIDEDRVILTGDSLGAMGAWNLAGRYPDMFAALTPVTAHGPAWVAEKLTDLPIRAWHGDSDKAVPMKEHVSLVYRIKELGGDAEIKIIPGGTHGSVIGMNWKDPEWIEWIAKQRRNGE